MRSERCPDDERLAAFAEGMLAASERESCETHVATCANCLDVVAALLPPADAVNVAFERTSAPTRSTAPARRGGLRRWAVAAALVATTGAALVLAFQERVAPRIASLGSGILGMRLAAETVSVTRADGAAFRVRLGHVSIGAEHGRQVRIEELSMTMALAAPLRGEPVLAALRAVRPVVAFPRREDAGALPWGDGTRVVSALQRLGHVELVDGRIELPVRGGALVVTAISGEMRQTASGHALALAGRVGAGDVAVTGTIAADGGLALTIGGRDLDASALPLLAGRVTGRTMVRLDVRGTAAHPRVEGRLALHDGRLVGVRPLWTMPLTDEIRGRLGTVRPSLAGDDFPFDELRASYEWRDGRWRMPQVYVQEDGILAGGRARVDRDGELRGKGTVRIPEDVVAAAAPLVPALGEARDPAGTATVPFELSGRVSAPRLDLDRP